MFSHTYSKIIVCLHLSSCDFLDKILLILHAADEFELVETDYCRTKLKIQLQISNLWSSKQLTIYLPKFNDHFTCIRVFVSKIFTVWKSCVVYNSVRHTEIAKNRVWISFSPTLHLNQMSSVIFGCIVSYNYVQLCNK